MIVKSNRDEFLNYLNDTSGLKAGDVEAVYIPETYEEVSQVLQLAAKEQKLVTVSGNGTGTTGGRVAPGGLILATDKLNQIHSVTKNLDGTGLITVQAGVLLSTVHVEAKRYGMIYPPDPTENSAFIGGTVATNASGARSFRFGATRNWVESIKVALPDGFILSLKRGEIVANDFQFNFSSGSKTYSFSAPEYLMPDIKHAAGYYSKPDMDLIDLFIGSEGTLGVIIEVQLKLLPKPEKVFSGILFFPSETNLLNFVEIAEKLSNENVNSTELLNATSLEFFDEQSLLFLKGKYPKTPDEAKGAIYFEQECTAQTEDSLLEAWYNLALEHEALIDSSWFAQNPKDDEFFKEYRHALPALINEFLSRNGVKKISSDIAVPELHFRDMMKVYHAHLDGSPFKWVIFGHIGDHHLHMNILPHNEAEHTAGKVIYNQFISEALKMGGTISAEHGVGKLKVQYLEQMYGKEGIKQMAKVKACFDPAGLLGRGTLIPETFLST
ncbi:MAG: FAD-binding oxidoreductase [Bacteroidetes bacterium]|nr:FAD-binding oxidoreductase [Bacteroidota bacterium]